MQIPIKSFMWYFLWIILRLAQAKKDLELYCGVCRALIVEIEKAIQEVDPKKTIPMGSFRIDPKGNQIAKDIPYARSEVYLHEVLDDVCKKFDNYIVETDPETKIRSVILPPEGEDSEVSLEKKIPGKLKFMCESIVEEHDDEIVHLFSRNTSDLEKKLCTDLTDVCHDENVEDREEL